MLSERLKRHWWLLAWLLVNLPLIVVLIIHGWNQDVQQMVLAHPNQFLFLLAIFPFGVWMVCGAVVQIDALSKADDDDVRRIFLAWLRPGPQRFMLCSCVACLIAIFSYFGDAPSPYGLRKPHATNAMKAIDGAIEYLSNNDQQEEVSQHLRRHIKAYRAGEQLDPGSPFPDAEDGDIEDWEKALANAKTAVDLTTDDNESIPVAIAEAVELTAVIFVVALMILCVIVLVRVRLAAGQRALNPVMQRAAIRLAGSLVVFSAWIPLRHYVISEHSLFDGSFATLPGPLAGIIATATLTVAIFFCFAKTKAGFRLAQILSVSPVVLWLIGLFQDVYRMRQFVGARANIWSLLLLIVVGGMVFMVIQQMLFSSIAEE